MNQYDRFNKIVVENDHKIRFVKMDPEIIGQYLGNRTTKEIIDSGIAPYRFCFDKALVVAYFAIQDGIETTLAMMSLKKPFGRTTLRAGIEVRLDGIDYAFHPNHRRNDFVEGKMPYKTLHRFLQHKVLRTPMKNSENLSWLGNFGINLADLETLFPGINIGDQVRSIRESNI